MDKPLPSFWRVIDTDYLCTFSGTTLGTLWGIFLLFKIFNWTFRDEQFYLMLAAGLSVVAAGLILWRYLRIRRIFETGQETRAKVLKSSFYRDRGKVVVEYGLKKDKIRSVSHLHTNRRTRAIQEGSWVVLLIEPNNQKNTAIKEAYLDS